MSVDVMAHYSALRVYIMRCNNVSVLMPELSDLMIWRRGGDGKTAVISEELRQLWQSKTTVER
jgi:hypothetical protein